MQEEWNCRLYSIVNQFSLEEFTEYTNFPDIVAILKTQKRIDAIIALNFQKNIPKKELWIDGGFSSLKLTEEFYESATAKRIFRNIYGIKECRVVLTSLSNSDIGQEKFDSLNIVEHGNKKRKMPPMKYPRKKMAWMEHSKIFGTSAGYQANAGFGPFHFYAEPKDRSKMKTNSVGTFQPRKTVDLGPLKEKRMKNWLEWDSKNHQPMTVIPLQNVACYLDETEIHEHFRQMFDDEIHRVRGQFKKYLEETALVDVSISNFWHRYFRVEGDNNFCGTETQDKPEDVLEKSMEIVDNVVNESKSSSLEVNYFPDYPHFESEVEVRSSPDCWTASASGNNEPDCDSMEDNSLTTEDLLSILQTETADENCEIVSNEQDNSRPAKRPSSTETSTIEKRLAAAHDHDYQQEYFEFLRL